MVIKTRGLLAKNFKAEKKVQQGRRRYLKEKKSLACFLQSWNPSTASDTPRTSLTQGKSSVV